MGNLSIVQEEFLKILETFMHDKTYQFPEGFTSVKELHQMAAVHKMTAAVYEQVREHSIFGQDEYREIAMRFKGETIRDVMLQAQREAGFVSIYKRLCEQGLRPLVVKGAICRNLYTKPDYRVSGDEDMLLRKEEFELCDKLLLEEGMQREELDMENLPYEIPYRNPHNGVYIELHFSLFPKESGAYGHLNNEFAEVFDKCICEKVQNVDIWTLDPTLHLFYLICHAFKHFLHGGVGIRQVCDMIKMAEYYGEKIDWRYIESRLRELRMWDFWKGLVEIGREHLGFIPENVSYPKQMLTEQIDPSHLLLDLLDSGVFGDSTMERKHSANVTLAAAESGKKDMTASLRASLFPKMSYMKNGYPWLEKYPIILPVAWMMRIASYLRYSNKKSDESSSIEIGMDRVELLREYHIID